jgi:hypothetical protein
MKMKTIIFLVTLFISSATFAQTLPIQPPVKKIEVNGSAEMEVTPDEIYVTIALQEYFQDKDKNRVEIETLEKQLQNSVKDAGIAKENFQIENISGNRWQWQNKKKPVDFLESKRYVIKVSELSKIDNILSKVDAKGIAYTNISRYEHSKIEQFRKELKIKALQAAKEKATYLVQAVGENLGGVLEINEMGGTDGDQPVPMYARSNMMVMDQAEGAMAAPQETIDFKKIKLRYEIRAVFAIK